MSETKNQRGKKKIDLPSAEKVQEELSKAENMDDFFGKDGIFAKLFATPVPVSFREHHGADAGSRIERSSRL